jgi:transposase
MGDKVFLWGVSALLAVKTRSGRPDKLTKTQKKQLKKWPRMDHKVLASPVLLENPNDSGTDLQEIQSSLQCQIPQ